MDSTNPDPAHISDDDLTLQNYQDDLDTSSQIHDPIMDENDDITEELGVSPKAFKEELDHYDFKDNDPFDSAEDDRREELEDYYQDQEED